MAMIQHSHDFVAAGIPHIFDPGQGMTLFNGDELKQLIREAQYIVVNDYEFQLLKERTGMNGGAIAEQVEALIVTRGAEGSVLRTRDGVRDVSVVEPEDVQDPTGCGDAFRAGLIYGLLNDLDLVTCCRIGSVMGAIKVARQGPQNHTPTFDEITQRFFDNFGYRF
jgi:adenosine kinase